MPADTPPGPVSHCLLEPPGSEFQLNCLFQCPGECPRIGTVTRVPRRSSSRALAAERPGTARPRRTKPVYRRQGARRANGLRPPAHRHGLLRSLDGLGRAGRALGRCSARPLPASAASRRQARLDRCIWQARAGRAAVWAPIMGPVVPTRRRPRRGRLRRRTLPRMSRTGRLPDSDSEVRTRTAGPDDFWRACRPGKDGGRHGSGPGLYAHTRLGPGR